jgi:hypothetical protein
MNGRLYLLCNPYSLLGQFDLWFEFEKAKRFESPIGWMTEATMLRVMRSAPKPLLDYLEGLVGNGH